MILGIGIDIVSIKKIKKLIDIYNERFLQRVYTKKERNVPLKSLAARFAVKEAFMKALSTGYNKGVKFKDIEVPGFNKNPEIVISKNIKALFPDIGNVHVSISHEDEYAVAFVIIEKKEEK